MKHLLQQVMGNNRYNCSTCSSPGPHRPSQLSLQGQWDALGALRTIRFYMVLLWSPWRGWGTAGDVLLKAGPEGRPWQAGGGGCPGREGGPSPGLAFLMAPHCRPPRQSKEVRERRKKRGNRKRKGRTSDTLARPGVLPPPTALHYRPLRDVNNTCQSQISRELRPED